MDAYAGKVDAQIGSPRLRYGGRERSARNRENEDGAFDGWASLWKSADCLIANARSASPRDCGSGGEAAYKFGGEREGGLQTQRVSRPSVPRSVPMRWGVGPNPSTTRPGGGPTSPSSTTRPTTSS